MAFKGNNRSSHGGKFNADDGELRQGLRSKLLDVVGPVVGPPCLVCGEPIDTRSSRQNGNVVQGWVHEDWSSGPPKRSCLMTAENMEHDLAENDELAAEAAELEAMLKGGS